MTDREELNNLAEAAEEFNRHECRSDGAVVAGSLANGLALLCDSLYDRVHLDVEREIGADSMIVPLSEAKARRRTTQEIDAYQVAESALAACQYGYASDADHWYLEWLAALRLEPGELALDIRERCLGYMTKDSDERRLVFSDILGRVLPESRRAPLVLFRLVPLAVRIATAVAFSDRTTATGLRRQQVALLPSIADCQRCQGQVLEDSSPCPKCGNPLWNYEWLTAVG